MQKKQFRRFNRKPKFCKFCKFDDFSVDYKNSDSLLEFISDKGKIKPRRATGTCAKHQRGLATEIKRARILAYIPFVKEAK